MGFLDFLFGPKHSQFNFSCPNCKAAVDSGLERCTACGLKLKSALRRKCPKCGAANELDAGKCVKCGYNLAADDKPVFIYRCSVCGNESSKFFTVCSTCGNRVV